MALIDYLQIICFRFGLNTFRFSDRLFLQFLFVYLVLNVQCVSLIQAEVLFEAAFQGKFRSIVDLLRTPLIIWTR